MQRPLIRKDGWGAATVDPFCAAGQTRIVFEHLSDEYAERRSRQEAWLIIQRSRQQLTPAEVVRATARR